MGLPMEGRSCGRRIWTTGFLDPDIRRDPEERRRHENVEPLLVNLIDAWRLRPDAVTAIPNLFLASDYVRTHTDLATMESANEAARRAVNGILDRSGSDATPCQVWELHEPEILQPWREYDRARWEKHLPWEDPLALMSIAKPVLDVFQKASEFSNIDGGSLKSFSEAYDAVSNLTQPFSESPIPQAENLLEIPKPVQSMLEEVRQIVPPEGGQKEVGGSPGDLAQTMKGSEDKGQTHQPGRLRIVQKR